MVSSMQRTVLPKALTGIVGLDEITKGGVPQGRTTLVLGTPGAGKTILSMEFLYRGATQYGEPGIYVNFGDPRNKVLADAKTFDWNLDPLLQDNRLIISDLLGRQAVSWKDSGRSAGELLEAIEYAAKKTGAKRVALDDTDLNLLAASPSDFASCDLKALMRGMEDLGLTLVMTSAAATDPTLSCTIGEYLADCVISLEHRMISHVAIRRIRVKKYRGTDHGAFECPYQITSKGMQVLPISSLSLSSAVSEDRVSTGVGGIDHMLDGGFYRESVVVVSGAAGTGKSNLAMAFLDAGCKLGERTLYFSYEESPAQLRRNSRGVGMATEAWEDKGLLRIVGILPEAHVSEQHLSVVINELEQFQPSLVVFDSLSALRRISNDEITLDLPMFLLTEAKNRGITVLATVNSRSREEDEEPWESQLNCFADTILKLQHVTTAEKMSRGMMILKSRGTKHSSQLRELLITNDGLKVGNIFWDQNEFVLGVSRQIEDLKQQVESSGTGASVETTDTSGNGRNGDDYEVSPGQDAQGFILERPDESESNVKVMNDDSVSDDVGTAEEIGSETNDPADDARTEQAEEAASQSEEDDSKSAQPPAFEPAVAETAVDANPAEGTTNEESNSQENTKSGDPSDSDEGQPDTGGDEEPRDSESPASAQEESIPVSTDAVDSTQEESVPVNTDAVDSTQEAEQTPNTLFGGI